MKLEFEKGPGFRKFTPLPEEIEEVRREAEAHGEDPDAAEASYRQKLEQANNKVK